MKHLYATNLLSFALAISFALSGCASQRINPLLSQSADVELTKKVFDQKNRRAIELWNLRYQKESLQSFIQAEEEIARSNFRNSEHPVLLAKAYYLMAEYHVDSVTEKAKYWETGANWAEKAIEQKVLPNQTLARLTPKDAEALFWFASNLGRWASTQGLTQVLKYKDRVKKMIDRVAELQPTLSYGAVYRYYGVYYALLPGYTENDLKKSKAYFETALKKYPEYFSNHVLYAQYYASKMEDSTLYKKHLNFVVRGNPKLLSLKDVYPEQLLEQARAKKLLEGSAK